MGDLVLIASVRTTWASSMTPPSDVISPPSKAVMIFFR